MTTGLQSDLQVAVDTGGTFTDVAVRRSDGSLFVWKVPSTPDSPDEAVVHGITSAIQEIHADESSITRFVHGTTVATNTVITRTGAKVGLVTTRGFRDLLAIGHQSRPLLYDQHVHRATSLVPTEFIAEVDERIDFTGAILSPLKEEDLRAAADKLKAADLDVVVVSFLSSYVNSEHEQRAVQFLLDAKAAPAIFAASAVSAEIREYERTSTAVINGYVQPKISGYVKRLEKSVAAAGVPAKMWIMQSNGGLLSPQTAAEHSARTVLSGLAGGVVGAANWARQLGLDRVVSFDIGGTSTDIALIRDGKPDETFAGEIDSMPLRLPSVDVHTIGAGGGSIAWLDSGGGLRVGPQSAGAVPGPICYSRGGTELTVTDAHVVLGRLGTSLLGGRFAMDIEAARKRMESWGEAVGLSAEDTAEGIIRVINTTMARGVRKVSVERGVDVRSCHLMAFGGAGPLHGTDLLRELGMTSAVIPPIAGIASAVGMLDAPERHDYSVAVHLDESDSMDSVDRAFSKLEEQALSVSPQADCRRWVDARYVGQSYELTIPYVGDWAGQRAAFDHAHAERYGFSDVGAAVELVVARVVSTNGAPTPSVSAQSLNRAAGIPQPVEHRDVYIDGAWRRTPIYERADFGPGATLDGPLIINQFDTTVFVRPDQTCTSDEFGFLHLIMKGQQ
ncbi:MULTISPECIES: hydantoinase/oxoprolinase family protein [Paenarthrobacter]|uniref:hydantoinase/oxoprolinase family protein n=1 Tax=Paenarthrobacter TaxID=1742992 RepID=UPI00074D3388|nr:hydantoinase/oxoprolinase family protein [Paenarthrobacter ureafaciens]AMB40356.1 hydantoinase [Arthrobacter sp. ATCC 21022]KUR63558.1 hydantoinase [Arthrobacter sp. ATCC 21022]RWW91517.1 hydantoinase/oxoprolinase family protein [Paenarthrobacter ureafaciens]